jgi:flagellar M-ring protein FliF
MTYLKSIFAGLIILAVAMLAKPLLVRALQAAGTGGPSPLPRLPHDARTKLPGGSGPMAMPSFDPRRPAPGRPAPREEPQDLLDAVIDVRRIEGRINAASTKLLAELLQRHPDLAAQAVRRWLAQGNDHR